MCWVGVDIGTTHTKAVVVDDTMATRAMAVADTQRGAGGDDDERDADAVLESVLALLDRVMREAGARHIVRGLSIASVGEEIVTVDTDDRPTGPVTVWHDRRGSDLVASRPEPPLHRAFPPHPTFSVYKLGWLRSARPSQLRRAIQYLDLASFVALRLGAEPVMDWSHASRTGLFDPVAVRWDEATMAAWEIHPQALPRLVPTGTVIGTVSHGIARRTGLPSGLPIIAGGHDHLVGAFASGVRSAGDYYLSAGTSEAHLLVLDGPIAQPSTAPPIDQGRYVDDRHWYAHLAVPSGRVLARWVDLLYDGDHDRALADAAGSTTEPDTRLVLDPSTGSVDLHNLPVTASRGVVMRAVLEGCAIVGDDAYRSLESVASGGIDRVVLAGHATKDPLWTSLRLGLLDRACEIVLEPEATAVGAALLARRGVTGRAPLIGARPRWPSPEEAGAARRLRARYGQ